MTFVWTDAVLLAIPLAITLLCTKRKRRNRYRPRGYSFGTQKQENQRYRAWR